MKETKEIKDFMDAIMVLPKKPEWVVFTEHPDSIYQKLLAECNKLFGFDMSEYTSHDIHDEDSQFVFYIDESDLEDGIGKEKYNQLQEELPFSIDEYWEVTEYLAKKAYNVPTWVYLQGRYYDHSIVEVQVGIPKEL